MRLAIMGKTIRNHYILEASLNDLLRIRWEIISLQKTSKDWTLKVEVVVGID